jgi:Reverse transcriptase (RNA-dependent DNA polymerase)
MNQGLYEPTVMLFGMCNSPATFHTMMDEIFKKEIKEDLIIVYMDDILAFSKTIEGLKKIE